MGSIMFVFDKRKEIFVSEKASVFAVHTLSQSIKLFIYSILKGHGLSQYIMPVLEEL